MKVIQIIKTKNGDRTITGDRVGEYLIVNPRSFGFTITHAPTGHAIAHLKTQEQAMLLANILNWHKDIDLSFSSESSFSEESKDACYEVFKLAHKVIQFVEQPKGAI